MMPKQFILIFILVFYIQSCNNGNLKEQNKQLIELKVMKLFDLENTKKYGNRFYINAFHGSREDILDLLSVRNKQINPADIQKGVEELDTKNLVYIELISSKNIDDEAKNYSFQDGKQLIKNYTLFYENLVLYNNRTMEYKNEAAKPVLLSARRIIPFSKRIFKTEELYSYIFLLPIETIDTLEMSLQNRNKIQFLP